jgi:transcription antitermination factor NusG
MNTAVTHPGEALPGCRWLASSPEIDPVDAAWFAVHTRPRYERAIERQLVERGIATFLPTMRRTRKWSDRIKKIETPMFPCYLFVRIAIAGRARTTVLSVPGVAGFVGVRRGALPVPPAEIDALHRIVATQVECEPHAPIPTGQCVRMLGGCLDGVEGRVVRHGGDDRLVIAVSGLGRAVSVRVQGYDFEVLPEIRRAG